MSRPRVSVVTIFLDEELFLGEAIESVRAQTFSDWELILVDDGSRDRSADIARSFAEAEPERIRYLQHLGATNRGMSASRNIGLKESRGDLVAFLDGDDVWLPDNVESGVLLGSADLSVIGNGESNLLIGNDAANSLVGRAGADTMIGHAGDDYYQVDDPGDVVIEQSGLPVHFQRCRSSRLPKVAPFK